MNMQCLSILGTLPCDIPALASSVNWNIGSPHLHFLICSSCLDPTSTSPLDPPALFSLLHENDEVVRSSCVSHIHIPLLLLSWCGCGLYITPRSSAVNISYCNNTAVSVPHAIGTCSCPGLPGTPASVTSPCAWYLLPRVPLPSTLPSLQLLLLQLQTSFPELTHI